MVSRETEAALASYESLVAGAEINVVSAGDRAKIHEHVVDSLAVCAVLSALGGTTIVDLGSGGGFPAIPLALVNENQRWILVEAVQIKARFLQNTCKSLKLAARVTVIAQRAELYTAGAREAADGATARAVAAIPVALEYMSPLVRVGGWCAIWTTQSALDEQLPNPGAVERALGLGGVEVHLMATAFRADAVLAVWHKKSPAPDRFPRRVGVAKKRPLS